MLSISQRLFGEDRNATKLAFRSTFVPRLIEETVSSHDANWAQFWLVFDSPADVVTLLPLATLRSILASRPENIATLIRILCDHLASLLNDPFFPHGPGAAASLQAGTSMLRRSLGTTTAPREPDLAREALNCVRVLSRVFPCVFERAGLGPPASGQVLREERPDGAADPALDPSLFESELLWTAPPELSNDDHFVIEDDEEEQAAQQESNAASDLRPKALCLGSRLLNTVLNLLFVVGFTLPADADGPQSNHVSYLIWTPGIGSNTSLEASADVESARVEVLRLLLILISRSMYVEPEQCPATHQPPVFDAASTSAATNAATICAENRFLDAVRRLPSRRLALSLLCSLLNTAVTNSATLVAPSTMRSITNAAAAVPYVGKVFSPSLSGPVTSLMGRSAEVRKDTSILCFLVLDAILVDDGQDNLFQHYLAKLHRSADFTFLCKGFHGLFVGAADVISTMEGGDVLPGLAEALVLFWRILEVNPRFLTAVLASTTVSADLLCSLMLFCLDKKDDASSLGLIRLCAFVLQTLSAERTFAARLNIPTSSVSVRAAHRGRWAVPGSVAEFLVVSLYTLIFSTKGALSSLYATFTAILVNCSPYFKQLGVVASSRLTQLFLAFSAPVFLLAEEDNPRLCFHLLETFNNVIHHQLSDNPHLIYAIIRCHHRFEDLAAFSLEGAVSEIRKSRADREALPPLKTSLSSASLISGTAPPSPTILDGVDEAFPPLSDKARGKMRERSMSRDDGFPGPYTSRTGFTPSHAWVTSWRDALPLDSILVLLAELRPKVESLYSAASPVTNQAALDLLRAATLLGLLPSAPPLRTRRFVANAHATRWLLSLIWSMAYLRAAVYFGGTRQALFMVRAGQQTNVVDVAARMVSSLRRVSSSHNTVTTAVV